MFEGLKGLFVEEVPDETTQQVATIQQPQYQPQQSAPATSGGVFSVPAPVTNTGVVDQKFLDHFQQLFDNSNFPGVDYYEFRKSLDALSSQPLDDKTKFSMVFNILLASDKTLTKQHIIDTANQYLSIMSDDKTGFGGKIDQKKNTEIVKRQNQIKDLDDDTASKQQQIELLTKGIQDNQNQKVQLQSEIVTEGSKIDKSEKDFETTYQLVVSNITNDINSLQNYL